MNNFSLINISSCCYDNNNNWITISEYKNKKAEIIFTVEYESINSWYIEWFKSKDCCNDLKKIILWLNENGSKIKQINGEICLLGVNLEDLKETKTTNTFTEMPFKTSYIFDHDIFHYIDVPSIKVHLNKEHEFNSFDIILE